MKRLLTLGILLLMISCNLDIVEKEYQDINEIRADNYQDKGWIPKDFFKPSIRNLYHQSNLDLNTSHTRFNLNKDDLNQLKGEFEEIDQRFEPINGLKLPAWWSDKIDELKTYKIEGDTSGYKFAVDWNEQVIYGWSE